MLRPAAIGPLTSVSDRTEGVLGLYNSRIDGFDTDDEEVAQVLARHAAVALATARKLVGQAMDILMERDHLNDDQAFAVLRGPPKTPTPNST